LFLLIAAFAGGMYFCSVSDQESASPPVPAETQNEETKLYTNERLGFSIEYPAYLDEVQENPNSISFRIKDDGGLSGFGILTEEVSFKTTEEWLEAQPKGSFSSDGYELFFWMDHSFRKVVFVFKYVVYDREMDGQPIYGRYLYAVRVENGILYKFPLTFVLFPESAVQIDSSVLHFVLSFKPLERE
jgi:hypothetical protein